MIPFRKPTQKLFGTTPEFERITSSIQSSPLPQPTKPVRIDEEIEAEVEPGPPNALDRIMSMLGRMPQRQEPGKVGKLGGILMAIGGRKTQDIDRAVNSQYYRDFDDFNRELEPLMGVAKLESADRASTAMSDYRNRQAGTGEKRADTAATVAQTNASDKKADNERADRALELKQRLGDKPNTILRRSPGMNDQLIDKRTGVVLAEYPVGTLRDDQYEALRQANRLESIDAQGDETRRNIITQGAVNQQVKQTPGATPARPDTPTQAAARLKNDLQMMRINRPDLVKWVDVDNDGNIAITEPAEGTTWLGNPKGPSQQEYDEIVGLLTGKPVQKQAPVTPPPTGVPMTGGNNPVNASPIGGSPDAAPPTDKRTRAIDLLKKQGKLVNEQTITAVMGRLK